MVFGGQAGQTGERRRLDVASIPTDGPPSLTLTESCILALPPSPTLDDALAAADPGLASALTAPRGPADVPGAGPLLLALASSANAALDVARALPRTGAAVRVAKLFARHIKLGEAEAALQAAPTRAAAGTPGRVAALADGGALALDRLRLLVLDVRLDLKQRTILDVPETRDDTWRLFRGRLQARVAAGQTRVALVDCSGCGGQ